MGRIMSREKGRYGFGRDLQDNLGVPQTNTGRENTITIIKGTTRYKEREIASEIERCKQLNDSRHPIHGKNPP